MQITVCRGVQILPEKNGDLSTVCCDIAISLNKFCYVLTVDYFPDNMKLYIKGDGVYVAYHSY